MKKKIGSRPQDWFRFRVLNVKFLSSYCLILIDSLICLVTCYVINGCCNVKVIFLIILLNSLFSSMYTPTTYSTMNGSHNEAQCQAFTHLHSTTSWNKIFGGFCLFERVISRIWDNNILGGNLSILYEKKKNHVLCKCSEKLGLLSFKNVTFLCVTKTPFSQRSSKGEF